MNLKISNSRGVETVETFKLREWWRVIPALLEGKKFPDCSEQEYETRRALLRKQVREILARRQSDAADSGQAGGVESLRAQ